MYTPNYDPENEDHPVHELCYLDRPHDPHSFGMYYQSEPGHHWFL